MIEIVKMDASHISAISEMEKLCFSDPWSEGSISAELASRLSYWLVAVEGGEVVGYIGSQSVLGQSDMMNVAVHPNHRRKGIAESLILTVCRDLREKGNSCLTLEVRASNAPAIALYEKLGFDTVGRRPGYYRHPKEDALIMRKEWQV